MPDLTPAEVAKRLEEFIHYPKLGYAKSEDINLFMTAAYYLRQIAEGKCKHKQVAPENKPLTCCKNCEACIVKGREKSYQDNGLWCVIHRDWTGPDDFCSQACPRDARKPEREAAT